MFQDEAGFGRINTPKYCWTGGKRPTVPCHHIREYRYAFGAVDPCSGDGFFYVMPRCDTICMNYFLKELSKKYADEEILLICDGAAWHKSSTLVVPDKHIYAMINIEAIKYAAQHLNVAWRVQAVDLHGEEPAFL